MVNKQVTGKEVHFSGKSCELRAFVAEPAAAGLWPAIIVVHEWWGLDDHIRDVARRLAAEGYFAVAPDLYSRQGHKVTKDSDIAADLMSGLLVADGVDDLVSTIGWIKNQPKADAAHIGVVGFCMGGSYATLLPCISKDIKAAAPFYGEIPSDDQLASLGCPIFYVYGENDGWIQRQDVDRLGASLKKLGKPGQVKVYTGCSHGFFNDTRIDVYRAEDAEDAWKRTLEIFDVNLKSRKSNTTHD